MQQALASDAFSHVTKTVIVDSRDRDHQLFPNPAKYEITMDEELQDVTTLELVGAELPMISYLVGPKNSAVHFAHGAAAIAAGTVSVAVLRTGDYTPHELATEVQRGLTSALGDVNAVRVNYLPRLDNYEIRSKQKLALYFADKSKPGRWAPATAARLLGFGMAAYESAPDAATDPLFAEAVSSAFRRDFESDRYAILHIDPAYVNYSSTNTAVNKSFAIIPKKSIDMNLCAEQIRTKQFRPPVPKLAKLRITLLDPTGDLYELHNRDHRFELRFTSIRQKKYTQQQFPYSFEGIVSEK